MKYYVVDAFTSVPFGGNPAGVVLLNEGAGFPEESFCVKTARELRYSETAFVRQLDGQTFQIRYFTPTAEVDLCGHATVGSFTALRRSGRIGDGDYPYVFSDRTGAGLCYDSLSGAWCMAA
ncbi:MAG: PhzF family phenazine biosynthesis protein, partial [Oscillospiraceae bacterium]|nr:PhzF family phenazine biosynthesis protein [Oscillospiraceae bacterium]